MVGPQRDLRPGSAERWPLELKQGNDAAPTPSGTEPSFQKKTLGPNHHRKRNEAGNASGSQGQDINEDRFRTEGSSRPGRKSINCNLDRFLESTCPSVQPQYLPKSCQWEACQRRREQGIVEPLPYFTLGELWDSFDEWSAYGAGVPITLGGKNTVVQYYVPYLSALQLYTHSGKRPFSTFRHPGEDSDVSDYDSRNCGSETSSDSEGDKLPECWNCECRKSVRRTAIACCVCNKSAKDGHNSAESEDDNNGHIGRDWNGHLLFEYFEESPPYARVPLVDKIAELAQKFPELKSLRSVDLLPASWMSVAWYPIYRIPTGPTLRDLAACFLTYHCLSTSLQDGAPSGIVQPRRNRAACWVSHTRGKDSPRINLQAFGLAHYKLRGSIWTSAGNPERKHASSLFRCAESWLRHLHVQHHDFEFFRSHNPTPR